jgi:hypothetical protein
VASVGTPLAVNKGKHTLEATAPGRETWTTTFEIDNGESKTVEVGPMAEGKGGEVLGGGATDVGPSRGGGTWMKPTGITVGAVGLVALGVGVWAGFDAKSKRDDARTAGCSDNLEMCPPGALGTADKAYDRANLSTIAVSLGVVFTAGGVVLWLLAPKGEEAPGPSEAPSAATSWHVTPSLSPGSAGLAVSGHF